MIKKPLRRLEFNEIVYTSERWKLLEKLRAKAFKRDKGFSMLKRESF